MSSSLGKSASHIFLRDKNFYYRKALPPELHDKIGINEIKTSLENSNIKDARSLFSCLNLQMIRAGVDGVCIS
ncbi:MAG: hypothetical protein XE12_0368 [Synergistales bacterium 54_9]|jgi:hypothetical protein|nr:MAG: hypothetical protein XE12_0368 [Synergistales bacterium 54_9]MDN5335744.1 hypothetical protein [Synergistales bacterium]